MHLVEPDSQSAEIPLSEKEFQSFRDFVYQTAGISLSPTKKALVSGRLLKRLRHYQLTSYRDYFHLMTSGEQPKELQTALDLLTTNETYFFREPQHFEYLRTSILPACKPGELVRIWSAACSSGEEPYTLAMVLADTLGTRSWELLASDISSRVLAKAQTGHYSMERAERIPQQYLKAYCLKGIGPQHGTFLIDQALRNKIQFTSINLNATLPQIGPFDVIFLRNVLIYFDDATKRQILGKVRGLMRPGGYLFLGSSETTLNLDSRFEQVKFDRTLCYRVRA